MSTLTPIDWPEEYVPATYEWGAATPRASWTSPYTGQTQSVSYPADRYVVRVSLPPTERAKAGRREAFFGQLVSSGRIVRAYHWARPAPAGTLRGAPTVVGAFAPGVRAVEIEGVAGATLIGGDMLRISTQLLTVAYEGATFSGTPARAVVPLAYPTRIALSNGAAVVWDKPRADFKVTDMQATAVYMGGGIQMGLDLTLAEQF